MSCFYPCFVSIFLSWFVFHISAENFQANLKKEIEAVVKESKHLADELADMLIDMEVEDLKEKTKFDGKHVENMENIIHTMEERIKKLEESEEGENIHESKKLMTVSSSNRLRKPLEKLEKIVKEIKVIALSDDTETEIMDILKTMNKRITGLEENNAREFSAEIKNKPTKNQDLTMIKDFISKEESLRNALNKFKNISRDVKNLKIPTESKVESEVKFAKILKAMTNKLSLDEMKISVDLAFGIGNKMKIVKNDFEAMIDSLIGVAENLNKESKYKDEEYDDEKQEDEVYDDVDYEDQEDEVYDDEDYEDQDYEDENSEDDEQ